MTENSQSFISLDQFQLISEQEAKFILDHAEKQLKDIVDTNAQIVTRSTTLLTISMGLMIALISYSIQSWESNHHLWSQKMFIAIWLVGYLGLVVLVLLSNFIPRTNYIAGAEPADYFKSNEVFKPENSEYRLTAIYVNEIRETQYRINHNKKINDRKWRNFNYAIYLIAATPLYIFCIYLLSTSQCLNLI